jgi:hypothetical protein
MKEEFMLTPQSRNLFGVLSRPDSTGGIFQTLKRQTATAGFIAFCGIISAVLGLWMWLWRDTTLEDKTLTRTVGAALVLASFFFYLHLRRGFGTFFLILTSTGIGIAIHYSNHPMIHGNRPEIPAIVLIAIGLIAYFAQTRYLPGFLFLLASSGSFASLFNENAQVFPFSFFRKPCGIVCPKAAICHSAILATLSFVIHYAR